jgi:transcriptional regulator with XRE-family HTH domain
MQIHLPSCAEALAALQQKAGMSQTAIGEQVGISQPFISNILAGKRTTMKLEEGFRLFNLYAERVLKKRMALVRIGGKRNRR